MSVAQTSILEPFHERESFNLTIKAKTKQVRQQHESYAIKGGQGKLFGYVVPILHIRLNWHKWLYIKPNLIRAHMLS
jgi:hypothetical protein